MIVKIEKTVSDEIYQAGFSLYQRLFYVIYYKTLLGGGKMKKYITLFLVFTTVIMIICNAQSVSALEVEGTTLEELETYTITEPVMTRVKVY